MSSLKFPAWRPTYFMHIPKTGGTSVIEAVSGLFPATEVFGSGFITIDDIKRSRAQLERSRFIWGHPKNGVAPVLNEISDIFTILRRPEEHAISNYLQIKSHPDDFLYNDVCEFSFADYVRRNNHQLPLQALNIYEALFDKPIDYINQAQDRFQNIANFIKEIEFVGVIDKPQIICENLKSIFCPYGEIHLPQSNRADERGFDRGHVIELRKQYQDLRRSGELRSLFEMEEAVYRLGHEAMMRRTSRLSRTLRYGASPRLGIRTAHSVGAWRFQTPAGPLAGARHHRRLADANEHIIYGPYFTMRPGRYRIEFQIAMTDVAASAGGVLVLEVAGDRRVLTKRRLFGRDVGSRAQPILHFRQRRPEARVEFRIHASGFTGGSLTFDGVNIVPERTWDRLTAALANLRAELGLWFGERRAPPRSAPLGLGQDKPGGAVFFGGLRENRR